MWTGTRPWLARIAAFISDIKALSELLILCANPLPGRGAAAPPPAACPADSSTTSPACLSCFSLCSSSCSLSCCPSCYPCSLPLLQRIALPFMSGSALPYLLLSCSSTLAINVCDSPAMLHATIICAVRRRRQPGSRSHDQIQPDHGQYLMLPLALHLQPQTTSWDCAAATASCQLPVACSQFEVVPFAVAPICADRFSIDRQHHATAHSLILGPIPPSLSLAYSSSFSVPFAESVSVFGAQQIVPNNTT